MGTCLEYAKERTDECADWEDQGSNTCDSWNPLLSWICIAFVWVANWVCVAYVWVTTGVCLVWDTSATIINAILVTIESILGWVLSAVAFVIELVEMIPGLGTLVRWILNGITYVLGAAGSILDAGAAAIGIRSEKLLRVCTVILRDENGNPMARLDDVVRMLQLAADVYKRDANIRIIPLRPFKYSTGFLGADQVDDSWVQVDGSNSDADTLDSPCNGGSDWGLAGTKFQFKVSTFCFFGSWRRVLGYGAPITVFINGSTPPPPDRTGVNSSASGCGMGIVDFVTVNGFITLPAALSPRTIGHEMGHACMLAHTCIDDDNGTDNMMATTTACNPRSNTNGDRVNPQFRDWQILLLRSSKHVTYY